MPSPKTKLGVAVAPPLPIGPAPGDVLGGTYRLERRLGEGGMGEVFEATHADLGKPVAVKLLRHAESSTEAMQRFLREAHLVAGFAHTHVVPVQDAGWHGGRPYLVMPLLEGEDLGHTLERHGSLPFDEALDRLADAAAGLDALHAAGIVHRDIKPENLFTSVDGVTRILDFGLATLIAPDGPRLTREGRVMGTPHYIAPEAARGAKPGAASDRYALAVIAFELLTGYLPFDGDRPIQIMVDKSKNDAPPLARFGYPASPALEALFADALSRDPERRPSSARALVDALRAAGGEVATSTAGRRVERSAIISVPTLDPPAPRRPASVALPLVERRQESGMPTESPPAPPADRRAIFLVAGLGLALALALIAWLVT